MTEKISMEELSDEDLFIYIACADAPADKVMADAAFAEIHRRYVKQLYARCRRMLKAWPDGDTFAEELVQATLAKAYDKADTYEAAPDGEASASRTVAWLSKIALNLYRDFLRNPDVPALCR